MRLPDGIGRGGFDRATPRGPAGAARLRRASRAPSGCGWRP